MSIWIIIAVLAAFALATMIVPMIRSGALNKKKVDTAHDTYDIAVYKDQLAELERELERNVLSDEQAERGRFEIHQRMLEASTYSKKHNTAVNHKGSLKPDWLIISLIGIIPLFAVALYLKLGSPQMPDYPLAQRTDIVAPHSGTTGTAPAMSEIIDRLRDRLEENPEDIEGWRLLSRSLVSMSNFNEASLVYQRIYQMSGDIMDKSNYAEASMMASGQDITPDILAIFQEVADADPLDARANFYIGQAALQSGDTKSALQIWIDLLYFSPPDAPWIPSIENQIRTVAQEANIELGTIRASQRAIDIAAKAGLGEGTSLPGPTVEDIANAQQMNEQDQNEMIRSMVQRLADRLASEPNDPQGWNRLANAYKVLGETDNELDARRKAAEYSN